MSCMFCVACGYLVDTDIDPDSLYVKGRECLCQFCRDSLNEPSEFDEEPTNGGLK